MIKTRKEKLTNKAKSPAIPKLLLVKMLPILDDLDHLGRMSYLSLIHIFHK